QRELLAVLRRDAAVVDVAVLERPHVLGHLGGLGRLARRRHLRLGLGDHLIDVAALEPQRFAESRLDPALGILARLLGGTPRRRRYAQRWPSPPGWPPRPAPRRTAWSLRNQRHGSTRRRRPELPSAPPAASAPRPRSRTTARSDAVGWNSCRAPSGSPDRCRARDSL